MRTFAFIAKILKEIIFFLKDYLLFLISFRNFLVQILLQVLFLIKRYATRNLWNWICKSKSSSNLNIYKVIFTVSFSPKNLLSNMIFTGRTATNNYPKTSDFTKPPILEKMNSGSIRVQNFVMLKLLQRC